MGKLQGSLNVTKWLSLGKYSTFNTTNVSVWSLTT